MGRYLYLFGFLSILIVGCSKKTEDNTVVSERYVHKYGYAVSKDEFKSRKYPGQVITVLKSGVTTTATYENGVLHGPCTNTFPHSQTVETYSLYNQGNLVKLITYDLSGMPLHEEVQLSPTRRASTKWYFDGIPMCTEEFTGDELVDGQYFTRQNEVESRIEKGKGVRIVRDLQGIQTSREQFADGYLIKKETFFPDGTPESIAFYQKGVLHGEIRSFNDKGEPLAVKEYLRGKLHGKTTFYKNGDRFVEIYYLDGQKNGLEIHYIDGTMISQEILWENDKKHGPSKYYINGVAHLEYYYDGERVSENKWKELYQLDQMIGNINTGT